MVSIVERTIKFFNQRNYFLIFNQTFYSKTNNASTNILNTMHASMFECYVMTEIITQLSQTYWYGVRVWRTFTLLFHSYLSMNHFQFIRKTFLVEVWKSREHEHKARNLQRGTTLSLWLSQSYCMNEKHSYYEWMNETLTWLGTCISFTVFSGPRV